MNKENETSPAHVTYSLPYDIKRHQHLFAAWAASRAASVKGCRFKVQQGRNILEACGLNADFSTPEDLPEPKDMDEKHRQWRAEIINAAELQGLKVTHGVAAKLINCYLKSRFVCGGQHAHERVQKLHPPIDAVLLKTLADLDIGGYAKQWRQAHKRRWSKLNSDQYEKLIDLIKNCMKNEPLWKIEEHWKGNQ
jgi:hypothetical protein